MRFLPIILAAFLFANVSKAQETVPTAYRLKANADSFSIAPYWPVKTAIKANDTSSFGTSFYKTVFIVKTDADSVSIGFDPAKKPYTQTSWIRVASPSKSQLIIINFWEMQAEFSSDYIRTNTGNVQFDIPETYELANILYALTKSSESNENRTLKESAYYRDVLDYFKPFIGHPLLKLLEFNKEEKGSKAYYNFRENSFCFKFEKNRVVRNNQYNIVFGDIKNNLFEKLLPLINDFVKKSGFKKFYIKNKKYYESQVERAAEIMPVRKMWSWLENNFSGRFHSYRVVFSPLIKGSHSTQQFGWVEEVGKWFAETVMFVAGPVLFEKDPALTGKQKEGLASGIVFTEIDHNYINPVSSRYSKRIDSIFKNIDNWLSKDGDAKLYKSPEAVFNEYMTHAAYILYAYDSFSRQDFQFIKAHREELMIKKRKYYRFKEFNEELLRLYGIKPKGKKLEDLYPEILDWAGNRNQQQY